MRKFLSYIILGTLFCTGSLVSAQDLLPSDSYYKDNIAVNEVHAQAPSLRDEGDGDGGPGGTDEGTGDNVGGLNAPIGDAIIPIVAAGLIYGTVLFLRRRKTSI